MGFYNICRGIPPVVAIYLGVGTGGTTPTLITWLIAMPILLKIFFDNYTKPIDRFRWNFAQVSHNCVLER